MIVILQFMFLTFFLMMKKRIYFSTFFIFKIIKVTLAKGRTQAQTHVINLESLRRKFYIEKGFN